jgi:Icc-related predicted phosphoesterase
MTKIVCISDTHCRLRQVDVPDGDILLHAGDLTFQGTVTEISQELRELERIAKRFKAVVAIAGNHDWLGEYNPTLMKQMYTDVGVDYLFDSWVIKEGLTIYGSPFQPEFCEWAFNLPRGAELAAKWALIPDSIDVLLTHGPPKGIRDLTPHGERVGCDDLYRRVMQVKPQLHVFGHIHYSYGIELFDGITFVNASTCDERYRPTNEPIIIDHVEKEKD